MSRLLTICFLMLIFTATLAQEVPLDWGSEPKTAQEKEAHYRVMMQTEDWKAAANSIAWLFVNTPKLMPGIYINGAKIYEKLAESTADKTLKYLYYDSALWTYDARLIHFGPNKEVENRKAYAAYRYYYKDVEKFSLLNQLFKNAFDAPSSEILKNNFAAYMQLAVNYYKSDPNAMKSEAVMDIYERISTVITDNISAGDDNVALSKEQEKVDAFFASSGIINCDFIENQIWPRFKQNLSDFNLAKKVFAYSVSAQCTQKDYFVAAAKTIQQQTPTYSLGMLIGDKLLNNDDNVAAADYYIQASTMAKSDEEKAEISLKLAKAYAKSDKKTLARSKAYESLQFDPNQKEPYNLIGNLYLGSFGECKGGVSKVADRSIFIAAYDMYKKAGNSDQMNQCQSQFPSKEELFTENYTEGTAITIGCWINETVILKSR